MNCPGTWDFLRAPARIRGIAFIGGADATKEELYFTAGRRLLQRGFAVLARAESRILKGLYTTPEWETLGRPIYDTLAGAPGADPDRIGLLGISMGGYCAPRMAPGEAPFRCLAVWGACFDVVEENPWRPGSTPAGT